MPFLNRGPDSAPASKVPKVGTTVESEEGGAGSVRAGGGRMTFGFGEEKKEEEGEGEEGEEGEFEQDSDGEMQVKVSTAGLCEGIER